MISKEDKISIFEKKLTECFNLYILNQAEKKDFQIIDEEGNYIYDFEQDVTKLVNVYKVFGERKKEIWSSDFDEKIENFNLLWLYNYEKLCICRISMDCISERLEQFVDETNCFFADNNDDYIKKIY